MTGGNPRPHHGGEHGSEPTVGPSSPSGVSGHTPSAGTAQDPREHALRAAHSELVNELIRYTTVWQAYACQAVRRADEAAVKPWADSRYEDGRAEAFEVVADELRTRVQELTGQREPRLPLWDAP